MGLKERHFTTFTAFCHPQVQPCCEGTDVMEISVIVYVFDWLSLSHYQIPHLIGLQHGGEVGSRGQALRD